MLVKGTKSRGAVTLNLFNQCDFPGQIVAHELFLGTAMLIGFVPDVICGSDRVLDWFELFGGDLEWSPLARRFLPRPE